MLPGNLRFGYPVGMDDKHETLFAICNRLKSLTVDRIHGVPDLVDVDTMSGVHRAVKAGTLQEVRIDSATQATCSDLIRYTIEHFKWEETVMFAATPTLERRYPDKAAAFTEHRRRHLLEHTALSQQSLVYSEQFEEHIVSALSLYVFVRHWLISHIGKTDRELSYWCRMADGLPDAPLTA